ncbi:hypothetical protein M747DRAFT_294036 [Aspergillus niger ATCC 13496]|uniref:Uncharacterized protein n=1 Tax=Aspergillus niger ATCC 13496 TaxID=1353008 RepID=A0A370C3D6_ASPNG|nr:hypothetical protein M747DRAFT_294036 [Aspergillus niger ATCC 13496]
MGIGLCVTKAMINRTPYHRPGEQPNDSTSPRDVPATLRERTPISHPNYPRPGVCDNNLAGTRASKCTKQNFIQCAFQR